MSLRPAALVFVALLQCFAAVDLVEAQRQKFKIGGGAGFANLKAPDIEPGGTAVVGGFFGVRFNDNVSIETDFAWMRSSRVFAETGIPVDDVPDTPAFRFETNRYHLDGILMLNIGRRQPFHPFIYGGGGIIRRDEKRTEFTFETNPQTGQDTLLSQEVVSNVTEYEPAGLAGAGVEISFMYNVAARAEFRMWFPQTPDKRDRMFFFQASYFF